MIPGFSGCLCCIYILFRLLVFKLNMMMMITADTTRGMHKRLRDLTR